MIRPRSVVLALAAALLLMPWPAFAQAGAQTGTAFYNAYRAAFAKAKTIDEILPFMAADRRAEVEKTPKAERAEMFEFIKEMSSDLTDVKVLKETPTATGATLDVEATQASDKSKAKGQITLVKEGGAWKIGQEKWSSGS